MTVKLSKLVQSALFCLLISGYGANTYAAPGTLATSPLFVSTAVEPNVYLTIDDSGSMFWEMMVSDDTGDTIRADGTSANDGFNARDGLPTVGRFRRVYWHPFSGAQENIMPPATFRHRNPRVTWDDNLWVLRNHNGNALYYNPDITYTPWQGVNADGTPMFTDADPKQTRFFPTSTATLIDLTVPTYHIDLDDCFCFRNNANFLPSYYIWNDDGDGILEVTDGNTLIEIRPTTATYPSGRTYAEEIQNFANWFQYYRKRDYASKAAFGSVVNNADATRMGLDVFNRGHRRDVKSMTSQTEKLALLNSLYSINTGGGTPARRSLQRVGEMFRGTGANAPIVPAADGGECQQNFNIVMTDGFWNGFDPSNIGNADFSSTPSTEQNPRFDGDQNESNDGGNYEDGYSRTLADVAMHYYERDLRPDLIDNVPTSPGLDEAEHQHLVTYSVAFGLTGNLDHTTVSPLDPGFSWPDPRSNSAAKIDDLWHAAYNGRGQYLSAQNPEELEQALSVAIDDIAERTATASAASVTSARLTTDSIVFLSQFNTNRWQGTISAFPIEDLERGVLSDTPVWSAAEELDKRNIDVLDDRVVLTYGNAAAGRDGVPFQWDDLPAAMQADLRTNQFGGVDSVDVGRARLEYLRGSRKDEGQGEFFRERATLMGDVVHSGPVYVSDPNLRWPDEAPFPTGGAAYSEFKEQHSDDPTTEGVDEGRPGVIYVGANDGMIHGFDETTGKEILAYVPSNLASTDSGKGLHYLTQRNYIHNYYNDLTPTASDVYISNGTTTSWRTILVTGQRGGGRGYSALDITDPGAFSEAAAAKIVLWEFTGADDPDLGFTFSRPQIGMTNDKEWVAVFGNGYNDTGDGQAKLFIVKIAKGLDGNWAATDYTKIATGVGTPTDRNGLGTPALADLNGDGTIDRAYAGDLEGNMWAFDLSGTTTGSWKMAYGADPLFNTIGDQPITSQPALSFHPTQTTVRSPEAGANEPNVMVTFGTGQYMVEADKLTTHANYFYGVWDMGQSNLTTANLIQQDYRNFGGPRILTQREVDYSVYRGWQIFLPDTGERTTTNSIIRSGIVFFNTSVPTTSSCGLGGIGYRFAVDLETGGNPDSPVIDINKDGLVDDKDTIGEEQVAASIEQYDRLLTDDTITEKHLINDRELTAIKTAPERETGRISWQELLK